MYRDALEAAQSPDKGLLVRTTVSKVVSSSLFIDADMLAQQPIAKTWLPRVAPLIDNHECEISSYPERWYTKIPNLGKLYRANAGEIAGGVSIQKRKETRAFLED
jgi:hypothetical protein